MRLRRDDPEILNAVLLSLDDLVMAHTLGSFNAAEELAASAAALFAVTKKANQRLDNGEVKAIYVAGSGNSLYIFSTGRGMLVARLKPRADLKRFLEYGRVAVKEICDFL